MNSQDYSDEEDGNDAWDEAWDADDDDIALIPCPKCGTEVYEEAQQCPACGEYIVADTHPFAGRPWWWIALGILGIVAAILAMSWLLP